MMGSSHVIIGLTLGITYAITQGASVDQVPIIAGIAGFCALVPDVDHPQSTIRNSLGLLGHVGFFWLGHRGLTHTLLALLAVAAGALHFLPASYAAACIIGYGSHILADSVTKSGVPLLWPVYKERVGLKLLRTGGLLEWLIDITCMLGIAYMTMPYLGITLPHWKIFQ